MEGRWDGDGNQHLVNSRFASRLGSNQLISPLLISTLTPPQEASSMRSVCVACDIISRRLWITTVGKFRPPFLSPLRFNFLFCNMIHLVLCGAKECNFQL